MRARFPDCLSTHRFAGFNGQQSGRECIFPFRTALRFACAVFRIFAPPSPYGGAVFRRCGRPLGVSSRLQPLRGLCLRTACARASSRFAASNGQRSGRECIFTFRTDPQFSMVVPLRSQARLWLSLLHWAYYGLFPPLAAASVRPCASLARCSGAADALWACPRAFSPSGLHLFASVCSAKNARNDVHAVISDLSLVLPILCQCSEVDEGGYSPVHL